MKDYRKQLSSLSLEQKGLLLDAIMAHIGGDAIPDMDPVTTMAFAFIATQEDEEKERAARISQIRSEAGKKGGRPKSEKQNEAKKANVFFEKQSETKKAGHNPNNIYINNGFIDTEKENTLKGVKEKDDVSSPTSRDRLAYPYGDIVDYLNAQAGTRFRSTSEDTRKHIRARMADGYTLEDFKTVIDKKVEEWKGGEMGKYLRPSTLFGPKFESYLNQAPPVKKTKSISKPNRFHNFDEVGYDYDAIVSELNEEEV